MSICHCGFKVVMPTSRTHKQRVQQSWSK